MAEQLSQGQIDELLLRMSAGEVQTAEEPQRIRDYDFGSPKKFTKEQLKALDGLHETYARLLSSYFSGALRRVCEIEVLQIEEQRYYEYSNALPDNALIGLVKIKPEIPRYTECNLMMDLSTTLGFSMVDRFLGGSGEGYRFERGFTEIELAILHQVFIRAASRLKDAWSSYLPLEATLEGIETNARVLQVFAPEDIVVIVVLGVRLGTLSGTLSICLPAENLDELIERFSVKYMRVSKRPDPRKEQQKRKLILDTLSESPLAMKAVLHRMPMELRDLLALRPDDVIVMDKGIQTDVALEVEGIPWYTAKVGECRSRKAVKLNRSIQTP